MQPGHTLVPCRPPGRVAHWPQNCHTHAKTVLRASLYLSGSLCCTCCLSPLARAVSGCTSSLSTHSLEIARIPLLCRPRTRHIDLGASLHAKTKCSWFSLSRRPPIRAACAPAPAGRSLARPRSVRLCQLRTPRSPQAMTQVSPNKSPFPHQSEPQRLLLPLQCFLGRYQSPVIVPQVNTSHGTLWPTTALPTLCCEAHCNAAGNALTPEFSKMPSRLQTSRMMKRRTPQRRRRLTRMRTLSRSGMRRSWQMITSWTGRLCAPPGVPVHG